MNSTEMTPKEKIAAWFHHEKTPADAWKTWTIDALKIATQTSSTAVLKYLPEIVKTRHPEIENYLVFRKVRNEASKSLYKKGERLPDEDIEKIQELRKTHTIHEVVALTGFSPGTVQKYGRKYPK